MTEADKAISDYSETIRLQSNYAMAYYQRGFLFATKKRDFEKALLDFSKFIQLNPDNFIGYQAHSRAYLDLGMEKEANADLQTANELYRKGK